MTRVWRYRDYPLLPVGRLVLDRAPANFFADVEQAAFSPANFVPGVEASPDKLLQGRLFSYPDTQRYRLGPNYALIPVNCPRGAAALRNYQRDGLMRTDANGGGGPNYEPNTRGGPHETPAAVEARFPVAGTASRAPYPQRADDWEQPGLLYHLMSPDERGRLVANIAGHMQGIRRDVQIRQLGHFLRAHEEYGTRLAALLEIPRSAIA